MNTTDKNKNAENWYIFQYNRLLCELAAKCNLISQKNRDAVTVYLKQELQNNRQMLVEDYLRQQHLLSKKQIDQVLYTELYKYNLTILELAERGKYIKPDKRKEISLQIKNALAVRQGFDIKRVLHENHLVSEANIQFLHQVISHLEIRGLDAKFGSIAIENEMVTPEEIEKALNEQTQRFKKTRTTHKIGDILVESGELQNQDRDSILLMQNRIKESEWEKVLQEVGRSELEKREQNALFGAIVMKKNLLPKEKITEALRRQTTEAIEKNNHRWIGNILVEDFGLREQDRKAVIREQIRHRIDKLNLELGLSKKGAKAEIIQELDKFFKAVISEDRLTAYVVIKNELVNSITRQNMLVWLQCKKIRFGIQDQALRQLLDKGDEGDRIAIAKGVPPVPGQSRIISHIDINALKKNGSEQVFPTIVKSGEMLMERRIRRGMDGTDVCGRIIRENTSFNPVWQGRGVTTPNGVEFFAEIDGCAVLSEQNILSVMPTVTIPFDLTPDIPSIDCDCDFVIEGDVHPGVRINCRSLSAKVICGEVNAGGNVTATEIIRDSSVQAEGYIKTKSFITSRIFSKGQIKAEEGANQTVLVGRQINLGGFVNKSRVIADQVCKINTAKISDSIFSAGWEMHFQEPDFDRQGGSVLKIGDNQEVYHIRSNIADHEKKVAYWKEQISLKNDETAIAYMKINEKMTTAKTDIDKRLKDLNEIHPRTYEVFQQIQNMEAQKRQLEKQYKSAMEKHGTAILKNTKAIDTIKKEISCIQSEIESLESQFNKIYNQDSSTPVIRIQGIIAKGTVIEGRFCKKTLQEDYQDVAIMETSEGAGKWRIDVH